MEIQNQSNVGSQFMAGDLGITRRTANYIKNQEGFPPLMWVGRQWRVNRDAYEAWKLFCYSKAGNNNAKATYRSFRFLRSNSQFA